MDELVDSQLLASVWVKVNFWTDFVCMKCKKNMVGLFCLLISSILNSRAPGYCYSWTIPWFLITSVILQWMRPAKLRLIFLYAIVRNNVAHVYETCKQLFIHLLITFQAHTWKQKLSLEKSCKHTHKLPINKRKNSK